MQLDDRLAVLVAIGSAAAVNCHDCLRHLGQQASALAVSPQQMAAAAEVGLRVGRAARDKTETFASDLFGTAEASHPAGRRPDAGVLAAGPGHGCCGAPEERRC